MAQAQGSKQISLSLDYRLLLYWDSASIASGYHSGSHNSHQRAGTMQEYAQHKEWVASETEVKMRCQGRSYYLYYCILSPSLASLPRMALLAVGLTP
jgi:hypothetical protein